MKSLLLFAAFTLGLPAAPSSVPLANADGAQQAYTGIGRTSLGGGNCTAFFIRTPGGAGHAFALTAGHCVGLTGANEVLIDRPLANRTVVFNFFADTRDRQVTVPVRRVAYSTMKGIDTAIVELGLAQSDLAARGITPLELERAAPPSGTAISIVGAPASFFEQRDWFLRRARCTLGERAQLLELSWHFWDTRRNDCADMVGGFSGSPVLQESTGRVVGILNTTTYLAFNTGGDFDCYLGRPCEIAGSRQRVFEDTSYSVPVTGLLDCFTPAGVFDLSLATCPLDRGRQLTLTRRGRNQPPGRTWATTLTGDLPFYRWKAVVAGAAPGCRDEAGYSPVTSLAEQPVLNAPTPSAENRYLLCVVAGANPQAGSTWQPVRDASVVIVRIDDTPPVLAERYRVSDEEIDYRVAFEFAPPELSGYSYKFGPPETTRCDEPGYRNYLRVPIRVPKGDPVRFCFFGNDEAENTSPAREFLLNAGPELLAHGVTSWWGTYGPRFTPGLPISLYGVNLREARPRIRDAAGREQPLPVEAAVGTQLNTRLPADLALGPAQILVGSRPEHIEIVRLAPVIANAFAVLNDFAFLFYGLAGATDVRAKVGTVEVPIRPFSGADSGFAFVALPENHGLTGRQFIQVIADGLPSNRVLLDLSAATESGVLLRSFR